jgi:hypothetical protein
LLGLDFRKPFSNNMCMAKQAQHGGKRPGSGRKPLPDTARRDQVFSIKLTLDEKRLLDEAKARSWARDMLVNAAREKR